MGRTVAACSIAFMGVSAAHAQTAGYAMTAESGGTKAGCVRWSVRSMPRPTSRHPQQQLVYFIFTNDCGRNVGVQIASQTADLAQRTSTHGSILLEPEQTYGTAKTIRNYIFFDAPQHRFLNFWIFQSDEPFTAARTVCGRAT